MKPSNLVIVPWIWLLWTAFRVFSFKISSLYIQPSSKSIVKGFLVFFWNILSHLAHDHRLYVELISHAWEVSIEEFLDGCSKLKGAARSIDVHALMHQCRQDRLTREKQQVSINAKAIQSLDLVCKWNFNDLRWSYLGVLCKSERLSGKWKFWLFHDSCDFILFHVILNSCLYVGQKQAAARYVHGYRRHTLIDDA